MQDAQNLCILFIRVGQVFILCDSSNPQAMVQVLEVYFVALASYQVISYYATLRIVQLRSVRAQA